MDENSTFSHKRNRLSSNFFINKKKLDIQEMKKLYFKNRMNNYKENRIDEKKSKSKEKEKKFNNTFISKDNIEHFHISSKNKRIDYNEKEKERFRTNLLKKNILNKNRSVINNSCLILNDLEEIKSGETFKYSIRKKYKKEKNLQKIKDK